MFCNFSLGPGSWGSYTRSGAWHSVSPVRGGQWERVLPAGDALPHRPRLWSRSVPPLSRALPLPARPPPLPPRAAVLGLMTLPPVTSPSSHTVVSAPPVSSQKPLCA